jgi:hypothetical protein
LDQLIRAWQRPGIQNSAATGLLRSRRALAIEGVPLHYEKDLNIKLLIRWS